VVRVPRSLEEQVLVFGQEVLVGDVVESEVDSRLMIRVLLVVSQEAAHFSGADHLGVVPFCGRLGELDRPGLDVNELLVGVLQVVMDGFERLLVVALEETRERQQVHVSRVFDRSSDSLLLEFREASGDPRFDGRGSGEELGKQSRVSPMDV